MTRGYGRAIAVLLGLGLRWGLGSVCLVLGVVLGAVGLSWSSPEQLCGRGVPGAFIEYVPGAYFEDGRVWFLPAARCTTGVRGESTSYSEVVVDWGGLMLVLVGVALVVVAVWVFRRESAAETET